MVSVKRWIVIAGGVFSEMLIHDFVIIWFQQTVINSELLIKVTDWIIQITVSYDTKFYKFKERSYSNSWKPKAKLIKPIEHDLKHGEIFHIIIEREGEKNIIVLRKNYVLLSLLETESE